MVRLLIPPGEGQHPALSRGPESRSTYQIDAFLLAPLTASLWLLGRRLLRQPLDARFPNNTAYWLYNTGLGSALLLPFDAWETFNRITFASRVLHHDRVPDPTPFRWWARSDRFSPDNAFLLGALGSCILSGRSATLRSLSSVQRQFARLGVVSVGSLLSGVGFHLQFRYFHGMQTTEKEEESICVKLAALIRLQNHPDFMHTLNIGERLYLMSAINEEKRQLERVDRPLNHASNDSEPRLVKQSMAVSWLSVESYPSFLRVDFEAATDEFSDLFDTTRPPAERLDHMIKEASYIAALLRARIVKASSMTWSDPAAPILSGEYAVLTALQDRFVRNILALKRQEDPTFSFRQLLLSIDPDAPYLEQHIPSVSLEFLENMLESVRLVCAGKLKVEEFERTELLATEIPMSNVVEEMRGHAARAEQLALGE